jgi:hypothetical protein
MLSIQLVSAGVLALQSVSLQGTWKPSTCQPTSFLGDRASSIYTQEVVRFFPSRFQIELSYFEDARCSIPSASETIQGAYVAQLQSADQIKVHFDLENRDGIQMPDAEIRVGDRD